jgi:hypothetical protein
MHALKTVLWVAFFMIVPARLSATCPPYTYGIQSASFVEGVPDARGEINGFPNPNQLRTGEDILFLVVCDRVPLCGREVTMLLQGQDQAEIPVAFEPIVPGNFWRVRPAQPLAAGMYTLTYTGKLQGDRTSEVKTYVFRVEGVAGAPLPQLRMMFDGEPRWQETGQSVLCVTPPSSESCIPSPKAFTQVKPHGTIWARADAEPLSNEQLREYLFRFFPANDTAAAENTAWEHYSTVRYVRIKQFVDMSERCWIAQSLRVSDGEISSAEAQCFVFQPGLAPTYPTPMPACDVGEAAHYAKAWCEDNRALCAPGQPPLPAAMAIADGCARYADVCGPLLGKRAAADGACKP